MAFRKTDQEMTVFDFSLELLSSLKMTDLDTNINSADKLIIDTSNNKSISEAIDFICNKYNIEVNAAKSLLQDHKSGKLGKSLAFKGATKNISNTYDIELNIAKSIAQDHQNGQFGKALEFLYIKL